MEEKEQKIRHLAYILLTSINSGLKSLEGEGLLSLDSNTICDIAMEYIAFDVHQLSRLIFIKLGIDKRDELMPRILKELSEYLLDKNKRQQEKIFKGLDVETFGDYLEELNIEKRFRELPDLCFERDQEYAKYELIKPFKEAGFEDSLFGEFSKKIAKMLGKGFGLVAVGKIFTERTVLFRRLTPIVKDVLDGKTLSENK